jgi:hypothetical protein
MTVYVALDNSPRNRFKAPEVPGCADAMNSGNCQHSSTETPSEAEIAVRFNEGVVTLFNWAKVKELNISSASMRALARDINDIVVMKWKVTEDHYRFIDSQVNQERLGSGEEVFVCGTFYVTSAADCLHFSNAK